MRAPKLSVKVKGGGKSRVSGRASGEPGAGSSGQQRSGKGSCIRTTLEAAFFIGWLICTGMGGYFVGHAPLTQVCPPPPPPEVIQRKQDCIYEKLGSGVAIGAMSKKEGYAMDELSRLWKCSHAEANFTQANKRIYPKEMNLDKTKWKSILSVEPKAFFDKYLSQYPGDTRSVQPVVVFSHKPLNTFSEIPEVCKVLDVAVVPDTPGVCVAVTETFHDVASYHMLHADRQPDGTFALTSNSLEGRDLPDEKAYSSARALLLDYFTHVDYVAKAVKACPKYNQNKVTVGVLLDSMDEINLWRNSWASAGKAGINKNKFCLFTTQADVNAVLSKDFKGIKIIYLSEIKAVGTVGDGNVGPIMRRHFLQAWLAFAVSNSGNKMMWQSPGTVWLDRPDNIINASPIVETLWSFKGRNDKRAAPFFGSFDFFVPTAHERPVHLMHELLLHFDLVLAWGSLDAVAAYRLSENNARYGTTTYILPPFRVLHTELMAHDPVKIKDALASPDRPMVVVLPLEGMPPAEGEKLLRSSDLWMLDMD